MSQGGTSFLCDAAFNKDGNQTISGTGGTTRFNGITLNMGTSNTNILEVTAENFSAKSSFLTLTNGTFKLTSAATVIASTGSFTIPSSGGLWINGGTISIGSSNGSLTVNGSLKIDAGIFNVGNTTGNSLTISGSSANTTITGGDVVISGRWVQSSGGIANISGSNINISTAGQTNSSSTATFQVPNGSPYTMSGGTMKIYNANSGSGGDLKITNSTATITNGTFIIGQGATTTGAIKLQSSVALNNLTIDAGATSPFLVTDLTVSGTALVSSGSLTVPAGKNLTISGTLTNNAGTSGLVIQSDATGTGSLVHNTAGVSATVQRYFTGSSWDWHLISSPVVDQAIQNEFVPEVFTANEDFYTWYEPTSIYVNFKNSTTPPTWVTANVDNNFIEGKGYMIAYLATNPSKSFTGVLNNGEQTVAITKTGTDTYSGSNLVGNPYPSSIDWKAVSGWTRTSLVSNGGGYDMYIWNQTASNFGTFNSAGTTGTNSVTQYIPPMQGFFVIASDNGNLVMDNNVRVHDGASNWLKNTETTGNILKISVTSEENYGSDEAILEFDHESTIGGAAKMFSFVPTAPSIYLPKQSKDYSISFLNSISENNIVPVSFQAGADGNYTLIFDFDSLDYIQLLDKTTNLKYNLKDAPHFSFSALVEDNSDRFEIHFSPVGIEESTELNQINAYVYNNNLYVQNNLGEAQISLYDIQGRQMYSEQLKCTGLHRKEFSLPTGIYIVRLRSNNQVKNVKVFIN